MDQHGQKLGDVQVLGDRDRRQEEAPDLEPAAGGALCRQRHLRLFSGQVPGAVDQQGEPVSEQVHLLPPFQ